MKKISSKQFKSFFYTLLKLLLFLVSLVLIMTFVFGFTIAENNDMYPRVSEGDFVMYYRLSDTYNLGDVVVYEYEDNLVIGRISALSGDTVEFSGDGRLLLNGMNQGTDSFYSTYEFDDSKVKFPLEVDRDGFFILSDYRTEADNDSRTIGVVSKADIKGKLFSVVRRRDF